MELLSRRIAGAGDCLPVRVVQFGEGGFLRAFADWMVDLMNEKLGLGYGVAVVQPIAHGSVAALERQDGLYTTVLAGMQGGASLEERRLIRCVSRAIDPYQDFEAFRRLAEEPALVLCISNTTEAGIVFREEDRPEHGPAVSFPGKVTLFLHHRFRTFGGDPNKGLVFLPCELIAANGGELKRIVLRYAELWGLEPSFAAWVEQANVFCDTLVDRIVAGFPTERADRLEAELGYRDDLMVLGESFHLWAIQGPPKVREVFPADRVGLNVLFVPSIAVHRTRKVRILNGVQTAMTPVSYLCGLETTREAVEHPVAGAYVRALLEREILEALPSEVHDGRAYAEEVMERMRNPAIRHRLAAISLNSMAKWCTRVLPTVEDYRRRFGRLPQLAVFSLAALVALYEGERAGRRIELNDDASILELCRDAWAAVRAGRSNLRGLVERALRLPGLWGRDLNAIPGLTDLATEWLERIEQRGMEKAAAAAVEGC